MSWEHLLASSKLLTPVIVFVDYFFFLDSYFLFGSSSFFLLKEKHQRFKSTTCAAVPLPTAAKTSSDSHTSLGSYNTESPFRTVLGIKGKIPESLRIPRPLTLKSMTARKAEPSVQDKTILTGYPCASQLPARCFKRPCSSCIFGHACNLLKPRLLQQHRNFFGYRPVACFFLKTLRKI